MKKVILFLFLFVFNGFSMNDSLEKSDNSKLYKDLKTFIDNHQPLSNDDQGMIKTEIWFLKAGSTCRKASYNLSNLSAQGKDVLKYIESQAKTLAQPQEVWENESAIKFIQEAQKLLYYQRSPEELEFIRKMEAAGVKGKPPIHIVKK